MREAAEVEAFTKLVAALQPHLRQLVFVGGWAHRLYPHLDRAAKPSFKPLMTYDADIATSAKRLRTWAMSL